MRLQHVRCRATWGSPRLTTPPDGRAVKPRPGRCVVAGPFLTSDIAIDAGIGKPFSQDRREKDMIEPQARVTCPSIALVIPEGVDRPDWVACADCVNPALINQLPEGCPALGLK